MPVFVKLDAHIDDELHALLQTVITRLMKMLRPRGVLIEEMEPDLPRGAGCRRGQGAAADRPKDAGELPVATVSRWPKL